MTYGAKIMGIILICTCMSAKAGIEKDLIQFSSNPRAAIAYLEPKAQSGDAQAAYWLARTYFMPSYDADTVGDMLDVSEAKAQALRWYEFAAQKGHVLAQFELAVYFDGPDGIKNEKTATWKAAWYEKAALQGHEQSQRNLARMYHFGDVGFPADKAKAFKWYAKLAQKNDLEAPQMLGLFYQNGWGVPMDEEKARHWYRKSASMLKELL